MDDSAAYQSSKLTVISLTAINYPNVVFKPITNLTFANSTAGFNTSEYNISSFFPTNIDNWCP